MNMENILHVHGTVWPCFGLKIAIKQHNYVRLRKPYNEVYTLTIIDPFHGWMNGANFMYTTTQLSSVDASLLPS